jgi:photosystem II stability/assembly factor-like uncharacterized protein
MAGVSAEKAKAVRRSDRFQSVVSAGDTVIAAGAFGVMVSSKDNGASWTRSEIKGAPAFLKLMACGDGKLAALDFEGKLWSGTAGSADWSAKPIPAPDSVLDAACTPDNKVWVVGARGGLLMSADQGATWTDKSIPEDIQLLNVQFTSATSGVVAGEFGRVLVTHDGGATWTPGGSLGEDFYPQGMHFANDAQGAVVGLSGAVIETKDGGANWTRTQAPLEAPLYGVLTLSNGDLVTVGAAGAALKRVAGQWQPVRGIPMTDLRGVVATASSVAIAGTGLVGVLPAASKTN